MFEAVSYLDRGAKESRPGYFDAKDDLSFKDQEVMLGEVEKIRADLEKITTQAAQFLSKSMLEQSK